MTEKDEIVVRLRRIEGQVRGLVRMVEQESTCEDILTQLLAARAALDQAGLRIINRFMDHCLPDQATTEELRAARRNLQNILKLLVRM